LAFRLGGGWCVVPVGLLALAACSPEFVLPDGAQITCTTAADCPSGYTCLVEIERCVASNRTLETAKVIPSSVSVSPDLRARGRSSTVAFQLDTAVNATPVVRFAWRGGSAAATLLSKGTDGVSYAFAYTVGDTEPEGFLSLLVDTVSDAGIPSSFELPQALLLDFTAPTLVPDTLSRTFSLPPGAVVDTVTAAGLGGEARLLFAVSEPTAGVASLELEPAESLGQGCDAPIGTFHTCRIDLAAPPATQGAHEVFAVLEDLAGNVARLGLGPVDLDTTTPAPPDAATPGAIVYTRVPHGADDTQGLRTFTLAAAAGAVEPGARLVAFDGPDVATASRIGLGQADALGGVAPFALVPADRPRVYVAALDAAGNPSDDDPLTPGVQATLVRDVEWRETLAGKVALDPFSNPHRLRGYGILPEGILGDTAPELGDTGTLGLRDGNGVLLEGAGTWSIVDPVTSPPAEVWCPYTDTWRGELRAVQIAWYGNSLWRFTGGGWQQLQVLDVEFDGSPLGAYNGVAFDSQRGVLVLMGSGSETGDTWELSANSWRYVPYSGAPPVDDATMVYDDNLGQVLLFGGQQGGTAVGDTYAWDGVQWNWLDVPGPEPRMNALAVYDPTIGKVVLTGGNRVLPAGQTDCGGGLTTTPGGACWYTDTWLWDGKSWTRACDSTTADCGTEPPSRIWGAFTYDRARRRGVLFGGGYSPACVGGSTELCSDLYEWNGSAWSRITPGDPTGDGNAQARSKHIQGWDPVSSRTLVAGGEDEFLNCGGSSCRETWQWTGADWLKIVDPARAAPLYLGSGTFALDGTRREIVYVSSSADTTWAYDGRLWTQYTTGNPPISSYAAGASTPNGVFRYGGVVSNAYNGDLYKRVGTTWALQNQPSRPLPRRDASATWVGGAAVPHLLLFGGSYATGPTLPTCPDGTTGNCNLDDVWGYGAWGTPTCASAGVTCWRSFGVTGPVKRSVAALVATTGSEAILFGGTGAFTYGDTWRWNGSTWSYVTNSGPVARIYHVAAYDARRAKVVVASGISAYPQECGSTSSSDPCQDLWEFDGNAWLKRRIVDPEGDGSLVNASGLAVYSSQDGAIYAPSYSGAGRLSRWDGGFARRPALVAEVDFSASGAPTDATIERVELRAAAQSTSEVPGVGTSTDVQLLVGEPMGWRAVASAPSGSVLTYCASRTDVGAACQVRRENQLLLGRNRTVLLGAAPAGNNGTSIANVRLDYAEVKVKYRLPPPGG